MTYPGNIKQRAIELSNSLSSRKVLDQLQQDFPKEDKLCERTVRRWHKARPQLVSKFLEAHHSELGAIVDYFWAQDFHAVVPKQTKTGTEADIFEYFFEGGGLAFTREKLSQIVFDVWVSAVEVYGNWKLECLLSHIKAELPEIESKGFMDFVKENPYELIETIGMLVRRKTFKGTCPICEDWH